MSKRLIKILSICALAILCVLVIVGVSIISTEAVGCTLTINADGIETLADSGTGYEGKSSAVKIVVDGKEHDSNKITLTKNTEVTVTFTGVGYNFEGWYNGNYDEINLGEDKAKSELQSYTFTLKKNTVLTAVRNVKTYNVTYAGNYDDEATAIDSIAKTYEYNEPLATPDAKSSKNALAGWYEMLQGSAGITTKVANFVEEDVTIYPKWERQYNFEFYGVADYNYNGNDGTFALKGTKDGVDNQYVEELGTKMYFMENPTEGYADLNQNVCDYFINQYSNFKTMNGDNVVFTKVIEIYYKVNETYSNLAETVYLDELNDGVLSFGDVLEYVRTAQGSLNNVLLIDLTFVFDVQP